MIKVLHSRTLALGILSLMLLSMATVSVAQNRVVVIPMFGDDAASNWLGEWVDGTAYKVGEIVGYDGSSYIALADHTATLAELPAVGSNWDIVAESGATGPRGQRGQTGLAGADGATGPRGPAGADGANGQDGEDAASCTLSACSDDLATLTCGVPATSVTIQCFVPKLIFVSDSKTDGSIFHPLEGFGLDAADQICQEEAQSAGLPGSFAAWLSTDALDVIDRLDISPVGYVKVNGEVVATSINDLLDGSIVNEIDVKADGSSLAGGQLNAVWTGTGIDGKVGNNGDCDGWEEADSSFFGAYGQATRTNSGWTTNPLSFGCDVLGHLYCLEQ